MDRLIGPTDGCMHAYMEREEKEEEEEEEEEESVRRRKRSCHLQRREGRKRVPWDGALEGIAREGDCADGSV